MAGRQKRQNHFIENLLEMPSSSRSRRSPPRIVSRMAMERFPPKKVGLLVMTCVLDKML